MFNRRQPRPISAAIRDVLWPRIGWRRAARYYWQKLQRIRGTPESIAAGFACGAAASMMPLMGFHFVLSALFALIVRGSIIASAVGTVVGNPWTFPVIWLGTYEIGSTLLGVDRDLVGERPFRTMFTGLATAIRNLDGTLFMEAVWPIWMPMMVGSLPVALVCGAATYAFLVRPLRSIHVRRRARLTTR
jgi:hypothetical protein